MAARSENVAARTAHPHGLRRRRVPAPGIAVGAPEFYPAANDGRGAILLRSFERPLHRHALFGRSGQTVRRHRQRADLAGVSEHRHRQPQPMGPASRPSRRHSGAARDGGGFPPPRRPRLLSIDAVGHRDARSRHAVLGSDGEADGGDRRGRRQRRHVQRASPRVPDGVGQNRAFCRSGTRRRAVERRGADVEQPKLGLLELRRRADGQ